MEITHCFRLAGKAAVCAGLVLSAIAAQPSAAAGGDVLWSQSVIGSSTAKPSRIAGGDLRLAPRSMQVTAGGDLVFVGSVYNGTAAGYDWRVVKLNGATGTVVWTQDYDSGNGDDTSFTLALDGAGNAIVVGTSRNVAGHDDWRVRKYAAADGALVWTQTISNAGDDAALVAAADSAGNAIVGGVLSNGADADIKVVKYAAADGATLWERTLSGSAGDDRIYAIAIDSTTQDAIVAGVVVNAGSANHYTARLLSADGSVAWQQARSGHAGGSVAYDVAIDSTGAIVAAGIANSSGIQSALVVKYTLSGAESWAKVFPSADPAMRKEAFVLRLNAADEAFVAGYTTDPVRRYADGWMTRIAPSGTTAWENALIGFSFDYHYAMALGPDGHPVTSSFISGFPRMVVRKYDGNDGGLYWGGQYVSAGNYWEPAAIVAAGTSAWVFGTWGDTGLLSGTIRLHVKRFDNPAIGNVPSKFGFKEQFKSPGTTVTSEAVVISGFVGTLPIQIADGEYSKGCNDVFTSAAGTLTSGDTVCVRHVTGGTVQQVRESVLTVGTAEARFKSTAKWPVTVTMTMSPTTIRYQQESFRMDATVTSPNGTPTGTVIFERNYWSSYDNAGNISYYNACPPNRTLNASGAAGCNSGSVYLGDIGHRVRYQGDANFQPADSAYQILTTVANPQVIVGYGPMPDRAVDTTFTMQVSTSATLSARITSLTPAVCTAAISGAQRIVSLIALGNCTLRADHAGLEGYLPADPVDQTFAVKHDQVIDFAALPNKTYEDPPLALSASGGESGNPPVFSSQTPAVCATSGTNSATLTLLAAGVCTVAANQAGAALYLSAQPKLQSFTIAKFAQAVSFAEPAPRELGDPALQLTAGTLGSSGIPVVFASLTPAVCATTRANGATLTLRAVGTCTITANQAGNGSYLAAGAVTRSFAIGQADTARTDFNGDGKSDILWRNSASGLLYGLQLNGLSLGAGGVIHSADPLWKIAATGDLNGDGRVDVVYRHDTTGQLYALLLRDFSVIGEGVVYNVPDLHWQVAGAGDFNGDGKTDLLLRNDQSGQLFVLLMNGLAQLGGSFIYTEPALNWQVAGVGDFNGDGKADVLYRNSATGQLYVLLMNTYLIAAQGSPYTQADLNWKVAGIGDFDADGKDDVLYRNETTGAAYLLLMNGTVAASQGSAAALAGANWRIAAIGDYDGDGKADILWRNTATGEVYLMLMSGFAATAEGAIYTEPDASWAIVGK